jgi:CheY-like chemotaxis protein
MILIADDDAPVMDYYVWALQEAGLKVELVSNCRALLLRLPEAKEVQMVVLDAFLPSGERSESLSEDGEIAHGVTLCGKLRAVYPDLRMVFLTNMRSTHYLDSIPIDVPVYSKTETPPHDFVERVLELLR